VRSRTATGVDARRARGSNRRAERITRRLLGSFRTATYRVVVAATHHATGPRLGDARVLETRDVDVSLRAGALTLAERRRLPPATSSAPLVCVFFPS
jgi:hypothetical protein